MFGLRWSCRWVFAGVVRGLVWRGSCMYMMEFLKWILVEIEDSVVVSWVPGSGRAVMIVAMVCS